MRNENAIMPFKDGAGTDAAMCKWEDLHVRCGVRFRRAGGVTANVVVGRRLVCVAGNGSTFRSGTGGIDGPSAVAPTASIGPTGYRVSARLRRCRRRRGP